MFCLSLCSYRHFIRNNMFMSTIMKDFPLHFENLMYVPNFTKWMSGVSSCLFTSLRVVHYLLTLNLRDLKFFRFSKSVSIYREGCFEEFFLILLQKDQKQWKVGRICIWSVRNLQFSYIMEKNPSKICWNKNIHLLDIHR